MKRATSGGFVVRLVRADTELAVVVAHELSHILLLHTGEVFGRGSARLENDADYYAEAHNLTVGGSNPPRNLNLSLLFNLSAAEILGCLTNVSRHGLCFHPIAYHLPNNSLLS